MNLYIKNLRKIIGHDPIFAPAAGCIIIKNNKILLQKRADNESWAIHGGYLELGENFIEGMKRKVYNEINVKPIKYELLNIYSGKEYHEVYPNGDEIYAIIAMYIAFDYEGELKLNPREMIDLKWFDIEQLPNNIHIVDTKPINEAIQLYKKIDI